MDFFFFPMKYNKSIVTITSMVRYVMFIWKCVDYFLVIIPPATKLGGYIGISLSVCRHKFVPPTPPRFMHGLWWNFTHVIYDMILCLPERHYVLLFFSRVMALDISKWKIVHVHYSLSLKWLVFCTIMYFRIL
jgi:hypothetical protein